MGALKKYVVTFEGATPPQITLGQDFGGAIVKELKEVEVKLVTVAQLAKTYNLSRDTIRERLASINQGTSGKCLYDPNLAHNLLIAKTKRGRPRAN
ncbi:DNA-binding protein [Acinetobacter sp. CFCC 10889]|uniref:DNA-binding protein n=1 Tax=Acinetobacter sp. CFCC 10889 TaxID=1775557 RepID=UPI000DD05803|nr:DNA-binding protein [Acinetobacter sp. CFCC 10889]